MANYSCKFATHQTTGVAAVDVVTFTLGPFTGYTVQNRDATNPIYVRVDGTAPTVAGNDTYVVVPGQLLTIRAAVGVQQQVQLICTAAAAYSVTAVPSGSLGF